jgi:hypothetical protein
MFFAFVCLFCDRLKLWTDPLPDPQVDQYIPFLAVPGPSPQYGMVPDNTGTRSLLSALQATAIIPADLPNGAMEKSSKFFMALEEFKIWVKQN